MAVMPMLRRRRLQRALDRLNTSIVPCVLVPQRRVEGGLFRWELAVLTVNRNAVERGCSNSAPRIPLSRWRTLPRRPWREERPGADVLPFRHPQVYSEAEQRVRLAQAHRRLTGDWRLTG